MLIPENTDTWPPLLGDVSRAADVEARRYETPAEQAAADEACRQWLAAREVVDLALADAVSAEVDVLVVDEPARVG